MARPDRPIQSSENLLQSGEQSPYPHSPRNEGWVSSPFQDPLSPSELGAGSRPYEAGLTANSGSFDNSASTLYTPHSNTFFQSPSQSPPESSDLHHDSMYGRPSPSVAHRVAQRINTGNLGFTSSKQQSQYEINAMELDHGPEADDDLHDPGKMAPFIGPARLVKDSENTKPSRNFSWLGVANTLMVLAIVCALLFIFAGWPLMNHFSQDPNMYNQGANMSGQVPEIDFGPSNGLIDRDTPQDRRVITGFNGDEYHLVFSDEFNEEGRTFGPGDDPYWEAVELHYAATQDLEYYRSDKVTTRDGNAVFSMDYADPSTNGNLAFTSGMLQSWNKFCYRGGYIEFNTSFPGDRQSSGFWAAGWIMGNLGRPGYLASTQGTWPYSYEACDVGALPNQTYADDASQPEAALDGEMSFLPGQRLSSCTCRGEDHPGPKLPNGTFKARAAPEIDLWEVAMDHTSQSFQIGPYDADQCMYNGTEDIDVNTGNLYDTRVNEWKGNVWQQAASCLSDIPADAYGGSFNTWGLEYEFSDDDNYDGYITWINNGVHAWTMNERALRANPETEISQRTVAREPMTIVLNFALSESFVFIDYDSLEFPAEMLVDYVRVYQRPGEFDYGCDGIDGDWPTTDYINDHLEPYMNPNLTLWEHTDYPWPKNALMDGCEN